MFMTYFFKSVERYSENQDSQFTLKYKRVLLPVVLIALLAADSTREVTVNTLSDAFWAVSTYVAFTLVIYHYLSLYINKENSIVHLYNSSRSMSNSAWRGF